MRLKIIYLVLLSILFSCKSTNQSLKDVVQKNTDYKPIDPIEYGWNVPILNNSVPRVLVNKLLGECTKAEILSYLMNEDILVSILEQTADGEINLGPAALSTKNSYYRVVMDYSKHRTVPCSNYGYARVGIGLRLVVKIFSSKSKVNLGDLFAIGFAAEAGHVQGTLSIEVIGIKSSDVTNLLPLPSEINQTTIQNAMISLASIKTKIYESAELYPQVIAIKPSANIADSEKNLINCLGFAISTKISGEKETKLSAKTLETFLDLGTETNIKVDSLYKAEFKPNNKQKKPE